MLIRRVVLTARRTALAAEPTPTSVLITKPQVKGTLAVLAHARSHCSHIYIVACGLLFSYPNTNDVLSTTGTHQPILRILQTHSR